VVGEIDDRDECCMADSLMSDCPHSASLACCGEMLRITWGAEHRMNRFGLQLLRRVGRRAPGASPSHRRRLLDCTLSVIERFSSQRMFRKQEAEEV
jgi:hypothetical protein